MGIGSCCSCYKNKNICGSLIIDDNDKNNIVNEKKDTNDDKNIITNSNSNSNTNTNNNRHEQNNEINNTQIQLKNSSLVVAQPIKDSGIKLGEQQQQDDNFDDMFNML